MSDKNTAPAMDRVDHVFTLESVQMAFQQFALLANHVPDGDVETALENVRTAHTIGPILDPTTKYRDALFSGSLERQEQLLQLYQSTKAKLKAIFPEGWM